MLHLILQNTNSFPASLVELCYCDWIHGY